MTGISDWQKVTSKALDLYGSKVELELHILD